MFATAQANEFNQVRDRFFFQRPWKPRMRAEFSRAVGWKYSHNLHGSFKDDNKFRKNMLPRWGVKLQSWHSHPCVRL